MSEKIRLHSLFPLTVFLAAAAACMTGCGGPPHVLTADEILERLGITRGIVVVLGDASCETALALAGKSELSVFTQFGDKGDVEDARRRAYEAGFLGTRIFIDEGDPSHLNLADNIADALVVLDGATAVSEKEALRVVHPEGKVLMEGRELVKPFPEGVDDWSHPYHGPDNNPQSEDTLARAPYLTQFLAGPFYAPVPQVTVSSAGRVFRALGHIAFKPREERYVNTIMAYNGYNGTILWTRPITPGIMVHRNTMIATPSVLYYADDESCKLIDTKTGALIDEITPPEDVAGGTFWKWMALENGVLYGLIGEQEMKDPEVRRSHADHGWPWNPLSRGFNLPENPWGYGRNILAIDPKTRKVLWHYHEEEPIDSRGLCMKNGRLFAFRFGSYLTCLDAKDGHVVWRKSRERDPGLFEAIGKNLNRQDWRTNWRTTAYLKCTDRALYFAGPMFDKLIVLSAEDGSVMWSHPYDNYQLVIRDDALYGISGPWSSKESRVFDPLTGEILGEFAVGRRACTRPTASADAVFFRADGGTVRFDIATHRPHYISPMRPDCFDGVTVANGYLYWWPSVCDCQLTLYGATCLGPAGKHDFYPTAVTAERLERIQPVDAVLAPVDESPADWPTFRGNNTCTALSEASIPEKVERLWLHRPKHSYTPTAPVAVGGLVFTGDSSGAVRALDAATGKEVWTSFTGGSIRIPPAFWNGRLFAGSGDGWLYALEAKTGRRLWRFRGAPLERKIPVYGALLSTWPAAAGVVVENGTAYFAAGLANYDNIYVYALDAATGEIIWQNNTSGHLNAEGRTGIGVQGHLLLHGGRLYMAGGNAVSPAVYDIRDGRCLNRGGFPQHLRVHLPPRLGAQPDRRQGRRGGTAVLR